MAEETDEELYLRAVEHARREQYEKSIDLIRPHAENGHRGAQMCMGVFHRQGLDSIPKDYEKALEWHLKAAHPELPENYCWLSLLYDTNLDAEAKVSFKDGAKSDIYLREALDAMERKAEAGDVLAMHRTGELYLSFGRPIYDKDKAEYWFDRWRQEGRPELLIPLRHPSPALSANSGSGLAISHAGMQDLTP